MVQNLPGRGRGLPFEDVLKQLRDLQQALHAHLPGPHPALGAAGQVPQAVKAPRRRRH
jgi:hypothetical protein